MLRQRDVVDRSDVGSRYHATSSPESRRHAGTLALGPCPGHIRYMHRELHLTDTPWGYACLAIFALAYVVIVLEERLHLRKSVPALVAASGVWILVALLFTLHGDAEVAATAFRHTLLDYAELMLFLLAAMTFVNTLEERQVFAALRARLSGRGYSLRRIFWITGALAFVISPLADNLTTALIMGAVSLAVGRDRPKFVVVACINVVVAANAGSVQPFRRHHHPHGLAAWRRPLPELLRPVRPLAGELVDTGGADVALHRQGAPIAGLRAGGHETGGLAVVALLLATIGLTVVLHGALALPPVFGMMTGLGLLKVYGHILGRRLERTDWWHGPGVESTSSTTWPPGRPGPKRFGSLRYLTKASMYSGSSNGWSGTP